MRRGRPSTALTLALVLAGVVAADDGPSREPVLTEEVRVQLVNVEVHVTDRKGVPVRGLTLDDFELLHDGEVRPITHFLAVENGRPLEAGAGAEAADPLAGPAPLPDPWSPAAVAVSRFQAGR